MWKTNNASDLFQKKNPIKIIGTKRNNRKCDEKACAPWSSGSVLDNNHPEASVAHEANEKISFQPTRARRFLLKQDCSCTKQCLLRVSLRISVNARTYEYVAAKYQIGREQVQNSQRCQFAFCVQIALVLCQLGAQPDNKRPEDAAGLHFHPGALCGSRFQSDNQTNSASPQWGFHVFA